VRLFVAVLPPAPVIRLLEAIPRPPLDQVRWTTPAQWHVTMRFLGEVDEPSDAVEAVCGTIGSVGTDSIEVRLGPATAWFPGRRVLQLPVAGLDDVAARIRAGTTRWAAPDEPPYVGHLTLARLHGGAAPPDALDRTPVSATFPAQGVVVMASERDPMGTRYEVVAEVPFSVG
jgi:2'-5' RNA ligase